MSVNVNSTKPQLSFWQIWNMSFGFLGIQFGFALQNANTSRIFETLGADTSNLALYWLAAPITGLLVQPIIGYYSDRTWHPTWGRRRPFFAVGAILATIALCLMPNSSLLWMAVGTLWIMDASINISMEPFRAFVGDMLPPSQRTAGFAMQSFFIGVGAVVASMLPWMFSNWFGISNVGESGQISPSVKYSFYVGAFMLLVTVMWTVFSTKEYPPEESTEENQRNRDKRHISNPEKSLAKFLKVGSILSAAGFAVLFIIVSLDSDKELFVLGGGLLAFGIFILLAALYVSQGRTYLGLVHMANDFLGMPKTMLQLAYVQFFSWFALFAMWIYTTSAVTSHIYDMKISAAHLQTLELHIASLDESAFDEYAKANVINDFSKVKDKIEDGLGTLNIKLTQFFLDKKVIRNIPTEIQQKLQSIQKEFNTGADWVGILFAVYNGIAALAALMLPILAKYTSRRMTHLIALCCGGVGLLSIFFVTDPNLLIVSMVGVGIAWASILSIPYAMLSGSLPAEKMGYYMGVFNFFIVIPQIIAGTILGFLLKNLFNDQPIYIIVTGGISMVLAGFLNLMVHDADEIDIKQNQS